MKATTLKQAAKSTARIATILAIGTIATIGLMAEPFDNDPWWFEKFFISKTIAAAGFYAMYRLYERWRKTDKWLAAYEESCRKAEDAENPI